MMPTSLVALPRSSTWLVLIICDPGWKSCAHSIPYTNDRLRRKKLLRPHYTSMVWLGMTNQSCLVHLQKGVRWDISKLKGYETCEYVGTQPRSMYGIFTYKTGYFMGVSVDKYTITFFAHLGGSNFTKQNASNLPSSRPHPSATTSTAVSKLCSQEKPIKMPRPSRPLCVSFFPGSEA